MERLAYLPKYTLADYDQWEGRWELIGGHPVAMTPSPRIDHQRIARNLLFQLQQQFAGAGTHEAEAIRGVDWRMSEDTVLCPDVSVLCPPPTGDFIEHAPALVAEVLSPSTARTDRLTKRHYYAKAGVAHYLLVDSTERRVQALRLDGEAYVDRPDEDRPAFELHAGCSVTLDVAALWP